LYPLRDIYAASESDRTVIFAVRWAQQFVNKFCPYEKNRFWGKNVVFRQKIFFLGARNRPPRPARNRAEQGGPARGLTVFMNLSIIKLFEQSPANPAEPPFFGE